MKTKRIFLWAAPRSMSTAFARSIRELDRSKTFNELFIKPYYYGPERQNMRYGFKEVDDNVSYKNMAHILSREYPEIDVVLSKNVAYSLENHFDILLDSPLRSFQHTFILRSPAKSVASLYKGTIDKDDTRFDSFDPKFAGLKELYDLYNFVTDNLDGAPVVFDADNLLKNPEGIMQGKNFFKLI